MYYVFFIYLVSEEYELTTNQASILSDAVAQVRETVSRVATDHRDLHSSVSKVGKAIDRVIFIYFLYRTTYTCKYCCLEYII